MQPEQETSNLKPQSEVTRTRVYRVVFLSALSLLLACVTGLLSAIPMRILIRQHGRFVFWIVQLSMMLVLWQAGFLQYAAVVAFFAILIATYREAELHGAKIVGATTISSAITLGLSLLGFGLLLKKSGIGMQQMIDERLRPVISSLLQLNSRIPMDVDTVIQQLPSIAIIFVILATAAGLIFERSLSRTLGYAALAEETPGELADFRLPDVFIWAAIISIFGGFYKHGNHLATLISTNVLNLLLILFFLQGMAVLATAFRVFKISGPWRAFGYLVFVFQLLPVASAVGFADYWIDFRKRFTDSKGKKPVEQKRI
jgi:Predicted membrane protein (DUF2232)